MRITIVLFLLALAAMAQSVGHTVTLTWADTQNPSGTTYSIYRAPGLCSGTPAFSKVASGIATLTYADSGVMPGNYCYQVTALVANVETAPSNTALAPVSGWPPQNLQVTIR